MTDTTVLQPAPGQTVVTTETGHRGHFGHGHDHGHDSVEARADFRSLTNEVERFGTANLASAARTNEIVQGGFGITADRIRDVGTAGALAACKTDDAIAEAKLSTAIGFKDNVIAQNVGFSAANVQAATIGSAAQVLATAFAGQARDQATANYNGTTVQIERVRAELEAKVSAGFAAATLLAFQNKADSDAKAAECCCELKALVILEAAKGRDLANEIEARRVQNELTRLQTQVAILTGGVVGVARS